MSEEMKSCPFCGSTLVFCETDCGRHSVNCGGCGVEGPWCDDDDEAISKWNRRLSGWISVTKRMPEDDEPWACYSTHCGTVWPLKGYINALLQFPDITHWMPLPDSPEVEE